MTDEDFGGVIHELRAVVLRHPVKSKDEVLREGCKGTVVHAWGDGRHYTVEFTEPRPCVVDVDRDAFEGIEPAGAA